MVTQAGTRWVRSRLSAKRTLSLWSTANHCLSTRSTRLLEGISKSLDLRRLCQWSLNLHLIWVPSCTSNLQRLYWRTLIQKQIESESSSRYFHKTSISYTGLYWRGKYIWRTSSFQTSQRFLATRTYSTIQWRRQMQWNLLSILVHTTSPVSSANSIKCFRYHCQSSRIWSAHPLHRCFLPYIDLPYPLPLILGQRHICTVDTGWGNQAGWARNSRLIYHQWRWAAPIP